MRTADGSYDWLTFNYDGEGRCTSIYHYGNLEYELCYDPFGVTSPAYSGDGYYNYYDVTASLNSSGYVSKMIFNIEHSGDYNYSGKETYTLSYDGSHLTKVAYNYSETGTDEYGEYKYSWEYSTAITWASGNVKKIVYSEEGSDDDEKWTYKETDTFEYGNTKNDYSQFTVVFDAYCLLPSSFAHIGYCGKGPTLLPKSCEREWEDSGEYKGEKYSEKGEDVESVSYTKNSDGLIRTETWDCWTHAYSYDYISPETRSMVTLPENGSPARENAEPHRRMFDGRGQHHSPHHNNVHSHEK